MAITDAEAEKIGAAAGRHTARELGKKSWQDEIKVYRAAERGISPIEIKPGAEPSFFPFISPDKQEEWVARASLVTACALKKAAPSYDKLFPNDEAVGLSKEDTQKLLEKQGVLPALSMYIAILADNPDLQIVLHDRHIPHSFYEISESSGISKTRTAMEGWIKRRVSTISPDDASDAEHIAWNFLYLSNVIEWNDSQLNGRPTGSSRMPPIPGVKSMAVWMMMHPEERLTAKVGGEESWGALGEWALDNMRKYPGWTPAQEDILPDTMFPTALHNIKAVGTRNLYDFLLAQGRRVMTRPHAALENLDWNQVKENPFATYYFDYVNPATVIFTILDKGDSDKLLKDVGTACRKLGLPKKYRETVLLAWNGVDSRSKELKYVQGEVAWRFHKGFVKQYAPNFFD